MIVVQETTTGRVEIQETVSVPAYSGGPLHAVENASVEVRSPAGALLTVYAAETGATTKSNPLLSDSTGRIEGWLSDADAVAYNLIATKGSTTYTQPVRVPSGLRGPVGPLGPAGEVSQATFDTHTAAKTGTHGIPAMTSGHGLTWNGTDWVSTDLATQAELNTHAADLNIHSSGRELARAEVTAAQGSIGTTEVSLTGLAFSLTAGARPFILLTDLLYLKDATASYVWSGLYRDQAGVFTEVGRALDNMVASGYVSQYFARVLSYPQGTALTFRVRARTGAGVVALQAGTEWPAYIQAVEC